MVSILKDIPIDGVKIVPCRVNGPRGIVKSFLVTGDQRLILVDTGFSDADADIIRDAINPEAATESVKRLIDMNLDLERLLVGHGDDVYEGAKDNMARIFAGPRA